MRAGPLRLLLVAVAALGVAAAAPGDAATSPAARPTVAPVLTEEREVFSPDGTISRIRVQVPRPAPSDSRAAAAAARGLHRYDVRGDTAAKLDLVVLGDGYTAAERATFHRDARRNIELLFSYEPFRSYRDLFNVWLVDVVSEDSGIDNDPTPGVQRDTALDAEYWCLGTERLICVNQAKAVAAAARAPEADQVVVLTNGTKYGGSGGKVATAAGANLLAGLIVVHELGHSIAKLADEYSSPSPLHTHAGEPPERNASLLAEPLMAHTRTKWYRWLGQPTPDGGVIGTYLGGRYNPAIFRPSDNSMMRSLNRQFNAVSREAMVLAFYGKASTIAASTPPGAAARRSATLSVTPARPRTHRLSVTWTVDGVAVARGVTRLDLRSLKLGRGPHEVVATVSDPTPWVLPGPGRDDLSASRAWTVA